MVILFDFDGTLVDTQILYNISLSKTLSVFNEKYTVEYCVKFFNGKCWQEAFDELSAEEGFDKNQVFEGAMKLAKKLIGENAKTTEGTIEALENLQKNSIPFAICSNSNVYEIHNVLTKLNLWGFFSEDCIFGREMVLKGKPESDIYLLALEKLGVLPSKVIALEDSINGVRASIDAKIPTAVFTGGTGFGGMKAFNDYFKTNLPNFANVNSFVNELILKT